MSDSDPTLPIFAEAVLPRIKDRANPSLCRHKPICPYCGCDRPKVGSHSQTLVSSGNHHWTTLSCPECSKSSVMENKAGNVWYVDSQRNGKLLRGVPSCHESYRYTCLCGSDVVREYVDKASDEPTIYTSEKIGGGYKSRSYRIVFRCLAGCFSVETLDDRYNAERPKPPAPADPSADPVFGWKAYEELGETRAVINKDALKHMNFGE